MHDQLKILGYDHPALLLFWFHLDGNVTNVYKIKLNQIFDIFFLNGTYELTLPPPVKDVICVQIYCQLPASHTMSWCFNHRLFTGSIYGEVSHIFKTVKPWVLTPNDWV